MAAKAESSRLNVFFVLYVLSNDSDEEHPISVAEIKKRVDQEFGYLTASSQTISTDTVKRTLEELTGRIFTEGTEGECLERFGYYIHCVMAKNGQFVSYKEEEGKPAPKKYYYYENHLTTAELLTLKDAVETYSFFSEEDITELIRKIMKLRPQSFPKSRYYDVSREERDEDSLLLSNIEELNRIISNRNGARITYCAYGIDKKLAPRPGYPKVIEPIHLMWSNGFYYLLAYNEKYQTMISMRVDRITEIDEVEMENTHRAEQFDPVQYRHKHPVMFGGEIKTMELLCRDTGNNYIMNTIVDVFGKNVRVLPAPDEMVAEYVKRDAAKDRENGIRWLKVTAETTTGGAELCATQYCSDCVIISPEESRERVRQRLLQGSEYYN
jgi:predicted DNA-binding transcriptional regulator YafY